MAGMTPEAFKRNQQLREILRVSARDTKENQTGIQTGPVGFGYSEVQVDPDCNPALVRNARAGAVSQPLTGVHVTGGAGGFSQLVHHAAPVGGAGPFQPERQESVDQERVYLSLIIDEFETHKLHILEYLGPTFVKLKATVEFLDEEDLFNAPLPGAIPDRNRNSILFSRGNFGGEAHLTLIDVPTGTFREAVTPDGPSGNAFGHSSFISDDGLFVFFSVQSTSPTAGQRLYRFNYPGMDGGVFLGQINSGLVPLQPFVAPGIWTEDRLRMPRFEGSVWKGLDHVFYDPDDGFPSSTSDLINLDPRSINGGPAPFPASPGHFYWSGGDDTPVKIGLVGPTGGGADLGWPQTWLDAVGAATLTLSAGNTFLTAFNVYAEGATGDLDGRFVTVPWNDGMPPSVLPTPVLMDYITPEALFGFTPGLFSAFPSAWLLWS